ncbi:MAG TPA: carboxypeptidase-like regulatory domain-containing protein, partial [Candidatus Acidoferrales bacterium]|nr:carboxypeptidase-like regulatory domain-containing protein [Candidatus Acidoferrales bacterium]
MTGSRFLKSVLTFNLTLFLAMLVCGFSSPPANAQAVGATLSGTVTDATGGVVVGAEISIKNVGTGISRTVTSDAA